MTCSNLEDILTLRDWDSVAGVAEAVREKLAGDIRAAGIKAMGDDNWKAPEVVYKKAIPLEGGKYCVTGRHFASDDIPSWVWSCDCHLRDAFGKLLDP